MSKVTTHSNVIQLCCTVADCDITSNPKFHFLPAVGTEVGKHFSCVFCVTLVMLAVKHLCNSLMAIRSYTSTQTQHSLSLSHTQTYTHTQRKFNHLNVTVSH